jgi:hypothetical protein
MKDIVKYLTITRLEIRHRMESRYLLELAEPGAWPGTGSTMNLTAEDMIRFGLDPTEELVGAILELTFAAASFSWETRSPDTVLITRLSRTSEVQQLYSAIPPDRSERRTCRLEAKTPVHGGTLVIMPSTYYELNLDLTEGEYRRLQGLPAGTALQVQLRQAKRPFRDVVLTYRGILDDDRVFPNDYTARMTALARVMIAYFGGDVDVVGHYCGLDTEEDRKGSGAGPRLETRTWQREYFAVDPLSPDDWETAFAGSVARTDAILAERYGNRLPSSPVREFYNQLETSTWQSKKFYPVEELTVGLLAKYAFRERHHLPSIFIEARSTVGNRKACQAACDALSHEAASLFGVRFDHVSLAVEEIGDEPESEPVAEAPSVRPDSKRV